MNKRRAAGRLIDVLALAVAVFLAPGFAFAAAPQTFQDLSNLVVVILNNATTTLIIAGIVVYFYGISTNILKFGEDRQKFKNYFLWGIVVLFVMVSLWGIINIVQNTLFGSDGFNATNGAPQAPASQFLTPQYSE